METIAHSESPIARAAAESLLARIDFFDKEGQFSSEVFNLSTHKGRVDLSGFVIRMMNAGAELRMNRI